MRKWSNQEPTNTGISWKLLFPNLDSFISQIVLRNSDYTNENYTYIYKLLNTLLFDKVFRFTSTHRALYSISTRVEVLLTMNKIFMENEGTAISKTTDNESYATYEETDNLDIDNLLDNDDIQEKIGNRESGRKSENTYIQYTVNELINREKRMYDYIEKEIIPLFSVRTRYFRKENYENKN